MEHETAGDPVSGCKWTRKSTEKIAQQLKRAGIRVSPKTVGKLLKQMNYSLRLNLKCLESGQSKPPDPRQRDLQFRYIRSQIRAYKTAAMPVISVDTKSRELNGIYDLIRNEGFVCVGISRDTSEFAVDSIRTWWQKSGARHYPGADRLLILADWGGSNGCRIRLWKHQLQVAFCDRAGLQVKVCHYSPGSSKWNPIEHRMFSFISNNWAAQPLLDYETVLKFIRTTKTSTGLVFVLEGSLGPAEGVHPPNDGDAFCHDFIMIFHELCHFFGKSAACGVGHCDDVNFGRGSSMKLQGGFACGRGNDDFWNIPLFAAIQGDIQRLVGIDRSFVIKIENVGFASFCHLIFSLSSLVKDNSGIPCQVMGNPGAWDERRCR
jgi:hypothetical protein